MPQSAYIRPITIHDTISKPVPFVELQLIEANEASTLQWSGHDMGYGRENAQVQGDHVFFHPLECEPTLQIG